MALFKPAVNTTAFAKIAIYGSEGSGKTFTASEIAIGISKKIKGKKVAFMDTETGSDFLIKKFEKAGIELLVHKARAFTDALEAFKEAEKQGYSCLIIDSITHVWEDLKTSYMKRKGIGRLEFHHFGPLKAEWQQLNDLFLNSKVHALMLGRAGNDYDTFRNEDTNKLEIVKVGTKMKAESGFAYEPSLLIEMAKLRKAEVTGNKDDIGFVNRATILKDRSDTMNGREFDSPKFETFKTFFEFLNLGGEHLGVDTARNSEQLFDDNDRSYVQKQKRKDIALEELQSVLIKSGLDGTSTEAKKKRVEVMEKVFGTHSKTAIEAMSPETLEVGLKKVSQLVLGETANAPS
jgi:hypothetical protein